MSQPVRAQNQRLFQNSVDVEHLRQSIQREQRALAEERRKFEREKMEFQTQQRFEEQRLERQSKLFDMKWQMLEQELQKLAEEKQEIAMERKKYNTSREEHYEIPKIIVRGEMFFSGVSNELAMRKRYKDLLKIYHPDNRDGDTHALQIINHEYDELKKVFCG